MIATDIRSGLGPFGAWLKCEPKKKVPGSLFIQLSLASDPMKNGSTEVGD